MNVTTPVNVTSSVNDTQVANGTNPGGPIVNVTAPVNVTVPVNVTSPVNGTSASNPSNGTVGNGTSASNPSNGTTGSNSTMGNGTTGGNSSSGSNSTTGGSTTGQVQCCDYFERGAGYEFSICDGVGAIIRPELIGGSRDVFWATQQPDDILAPVWTDLSNLVNNYCDQRSLGMASSNSSNSTNSSSNATAVNATSMMVQALDIPWAAWGQDLLGSFENIGVWLSRYVQYLGAAEAYLASNFPGTSLLTTVEQELANFDPNLNLTNVTYGELVSDYNTLYAQFISWYGTFFGPNGLIGLSVSEINDGGVVYRFVGNVSSLGLGLDVVDVERPNILPIQFESIAEWISTKFGSVILANSCAICSAGNGSSVIVPPPMNASNSTNGTVGGNSSNSTNGTLPVGTGNGTSTNGTLPVTGGSNSTQNGTATGPTEGQNGTLPVNNSTIGTGSTNTSSTTNTTTTTSNSSAPVVSTGPTP